MVPAVAQDMNHFNNPPVLQLPEAGADIRAGDRQRPGNLFGMEWLSRKIKQRMNLRYRAVDSPAGAHLAPMENELLLDGTQIDHGCTYFCYFRIYRILCHRVKLFSGSPPGEAGGFCELREATPTRVRSRSWERQRSSCRLSYETQTVTPKLCIRGALIG